MELPRYKCSDPTLEEALNLLASAVEKVANRTFHAGRNMLMDVSDESVIFQATGEGGAAAADTKPWDIYSLVGVGDPNPTTGKYASYKAKVWPGMLNWLIPTNIVGASGPNEFTISGSDVIIFKVAAVTNGKEVTSCSIVATTAQPAAQVPTVNTLPSSFEVAFAVAVGGQVFRCLGTGNITAWGEKLFVSDRDSDPTLGQLPYKAWYGWKITS